MIFSTLFYPFLLTLLLMVICGFLIPIFMKKLKIYELFKNYDKKYFKNHTHNINETSSDYVKARFLTFFWFYIVFSCMWRLTSTNHINSDVFVVYVPLVMFYVLIIWNEYHNDIENRNIFLIICTTLFLLYFALITFHFPHIFDYTYKDLDTSFIPILGTVLVPMFFVCIKGIFSIILQILTFALCYKYTIKNKQNLLNFFNILQFSPFVKIILIQYLNAFEDIAKSINNFKRNLKARSCISKTEGFSHYRHYFNMCRIIFVYWIEKRKMQQRNLYVRYCDEDHVNTKEKTIILHNFSILGFFIHYRFIFLFSLFCLFVFLSPTSMSIFLCCMLFVTLNPFYECDVSINL